MNNTVANNRKYNNKTIGFHIQLVENSIFELQTTYFVAV